MAALSAELRSIFEREVVQARDTAEAAAQAALTTLAVERDRPFDSMSEERRALRRALRARARQLGEGVLGAGMPRLVEEIAYEQWHRMLFARFLAENDLLMHPEGVAVTLAECAELAQEESAEDLWAVATRYASLMLPGIFRVDDPALQIRFAPEGRHKLEQIVTDLPRAIFNSDDGLGWAYQFWQSKKKDEVNASERKIGGADIAPVTQLFTEDYMVKFLLHNTLGAWWAHRHPDSPLNKTFEYLRYREDGTPAAGAFAGWPDKVAEVTMMDPCGGSGHFVVAAFEMLTRMRMEEEGLSATLAGDAVIRDNVHMLEIDFRCTQIAAFNLALAAWKSGSHRELPTPNIACTGIPIRGQLEEWTHLAGDDVALKWTLERVYQLFRDAPELGSLIDPASVPLNERLFVGDRRDVELAVASALKTDSNNRADSVSMGAAIADISAAAELLAGRYVLVITNVPYLLRRKQSEALAAFCERYFPRAKNDLATVFLSRCKSMCDHGGTVAAVTPVHWLFLGSYEELRKSLLINLEWRIVALLGAGAFETISGEVVNVQLFVADHSKPDKTHSIRGIDVSEESNSVSKAISLKTSQLMSVNQVAQFDNPDARVTLKELVRGTLLENYAVSLQGTVTGDLPRYGRYFWEIPALSEDWRRLQSTVQETTFYGGREQILYWGNDGADLIGNPKARVQGMAAWGKLGISVRQMGHLPVTLYTGEVFDINAASIIPKNISDLSAIWAYCASPRFNEAVRRIDKQMKVTNATLVKVPFDLDYWRSEAENQEPIPEPNSEDPTQWLFEGNPVDCNSSLGVSIGRLLGYRWPEQDRDDLEVLADEDGIICLSSVIGESPAAERLRALLARAYGVEWSLALQQRQLEDVGFKGKGLNVWLRDGFFKQHCQLFNNRPFVWHIWDGRKDGFSALVNYHKLDHARLERLIYTYLGDWINTQRAEQEQGVSGAEGRLAAALELKKKLELILEGEPPYDIYVRWKPLHEQPIGWNPDLNDGVRLNIRPFVTAGVLRSKFTIHWKKDRGKNPDGSERHNDLHFTRAQKEEARRKAGVL